ncbi:MAG: hypothetical protein AB7K24_23495 [Gemmataceae bacterium]
MMRLSLQRWLGTASVLGCTLMLGCSHAPKQNMRPSYRPVQAVARTPVYTEGTAYVTSLPPVQQQPAPVVVEESVAVEEVPPAPQPAPVVVEECEPVARPIPAPTPPVTSVPRRDFSDITARPGFRHNDDYTEIVGEIQYLHTRECWRLRYASVDEEDRYGGSFTLVETGSMSRFKSGQMVRVIGILVDSESREPCPAYRVRSIKALDPH